MLSGALHLSRIDLPSVPVLYVSPSDPHDIHLLRRIGRGDLDAFGELYDRYARFVYSLAEFMMRNSEMAEEITQDVFHRVWRSAASYRSDRGTVRAWIASITRNRAIDELRAKKKMASVREGLSTWDLEVIQDAATVEDLVERDIVREAVAALPREQRVALNLAFFGGYSHREIARALNIPLGTVKTRIRLGIEKLRQRLS